MAADVLGTRRRFAHRGRRATRLCEPANVSSTDPASFTSSVNRRPVFVAPTRKEELDDLRCAAHRPPVAGRHGLHLADNGSLFESFNAKPHDERDKHDDVKVRMGRPWLVPERTSSTGGHDNGPVGSVRCTPGKGANKG